MDKVEDLKKAKDGTDKDLIQKNYDALSTEIQKVGAKMYESAQGGQADSQPVEGQAKDSGETKADEPVEGEFEEVKK